MKDIFTVFVSSVILLVIDISYLQTFGGPFIDQTALIQKSPFKMNIIGALLSYICIIILLNYFVLLRSGSLQDAFLLGILSYGIYDMTNMALFKEWDMSLAIIDIILGGALFTLTTFITNWVIIVFHN